MPSRSSSRRSPPSSTRPQPLQKRGFGVTEVGLLLILVIGTAIVWRQQRQIEQLTHSDQQETEGIIQEKQETTELKELVAPLTWEVVDQQTGDAPATQALVVHDAQGDTRTLVPSLQDVLAVAEQDHAQFSLVTSDATSALLRVVPPASAAEDPTPAVPVGSTAPPAQYVRFTYPDVTPIPVTVAEIMHCPDALRAAFEGVDFSFCYPESWGATTLEVRPTAAEDASLYTGTRSTVTFADAPRVAIDVTTSDYTYGGGTDAPFPPYHVKSLTDDAALKKQFSAYGAVTDVTQTTVAGVPAVVAHVQSSIVDGTTFAPTDEQEPATFVVIPHALTRDAVVYDILLRALGTEQVLAFDQVLSTVVFP